MRCPRCGHSNQDATWYCGNCGAPLSGLNVADSVAQSRLPPVVRWSLAISVSALFVVALSTAALVITRNRRDDVGTMAGATAVAPPGSNEDVATEATDRRPRPTAAPQETDRSDSGGISVPTASVGEATAAAERIAPSPEPADATGEADSQLRQGEEDQRQTALASTSEVGPRATDSLAAQPSPTTRTRPGAPVWYSEELTRAPRLDGRLDDWRVSPVDITSVVFGMQYWDSPADLGATAHAGWDERALYIGVRVVDDVHSQPARGEELYLGDSIELQIDAELEADFTDEAYSADDWQIGLSPGDFADSSPEAFIWRPAGKGAETIRLQSRQLGDGYILEAALPWALFELDSATLPAIGLAINVSDNDLEAPAQLTMISSSPRRSWADPGTLGTFVLVR